MNILFYLLLAVVLIGLITFILAVFRAPSGYEDRAGFHYLTAKNAEIAEMKPDAQINAHHRAAASPLRSLRSLRLKPSRPILAQIVRQSARVNPEFPALSPSKGLREVNN